VIRRLLILTAALAATAACDRVPATDAANSTAATLGNASAPTDWQTTPSGLRYRRISGTGAGQRPQPNDTVTLHYVGRLPDGTEFDSSMRSGAPVTMPLPALIRGWQEGVPLMSVGDVYEFVIPPELGYGDAQSGPIPPNSTLHFTIGLIGIGGQG
jgi:FKBP-type peptidyl-prolyl cis-trans isomerase FkpA